MRRRKLDSRPSDRSAHSVLRDEACELTCLDVFRRLPVALLGVVLGAGALLACTGEEAPIPVGPSPVSSAPPSHPAEDGGVDPDCSTLAVPDLARVCADGTAVGGSYALEDHKCVLEFPCPEPELPVPFTCAPTAACSPGDSCASAGTGSGTAFAGSCVCDASGHFQCSTSSTSYDGGVTSSVDAGPAEDAEEPVGVDAELQVPESDASVCTGALPSALRGLSRAAAAGAHTSSSSTAGARSATATRRKRPVATGTAARAGRVRNRS